MASPRQLAGDGIWVGSAEVGCAVGPLVGLPVGAAVVGSPDGNVLGSVVGAADGGCVVIVQQVAEHLLGVVNGGGPVQSSRAHLAAASAWQMAYLQVCPRRVCANLAPSPGSFREESGKVSSIVPLTVCAANETPLAPPPIGTTITVTRSSRSCCETGSGL